MNGVTPPLPHMLSWHAQEQRCPSYFTLTDITELTFGLM